MCNFGLLSTTAQADLFATVDLEITKILFIPCSSASVAETWQTPPRPHQTFAGLAALTLSPAKEDIQYLFNQIS